MENPSEEINVCSKCVASSQFKKWIRATGRPGQCDIVGEHGSRSRVVAVGDFAKYVDEMFREKYQIGAQDDWYDFDIDGWVHEQKGYLLSEILIDEIECDENLVEKIIENLPDVSDRDITQGAEPFYDSTLKYEKISDAHRRDSIEESEYWYSERFYTEWKDFCKHVIYENRYFTAGRLLDELFGKPSEYEGCGSINPVYMLNVPKKIFRARVLSSNFTEEILRADPAKEVGAPPRDRATAGRMNVEFIPAFYGAFSEQTAIAETRPDIGDDVVIGEFILKRAVKVFDFTVFSRPDAGKKMYDHTRYDFIEQMEGEISRRVRSHERRRDYIPTQIIAEYLRIKFGCDAIIYHSAVISSQKGENRNIVFLPRSDAFVGSGGEVLNFSGFRIVEVENVEYSLTETLF